MDAKDIEYRCTGAEETIFKSLQFRAGGLSKENEKARRRNVDSIFERTGISR